MCNWQSQYVNYVVAVRSQEFHWSFERNITSLGEVILEFSKLTSCSKDLSNVPDFCDKYNYFILKMNTNRLLWSNVYYEDGHLHDIEYNSVNAHCSHCVVRASVIPSLSSANTKLTPDHLTWLTMSKGSGNVHKLSLYSRVSIVLVQQGKYSTGTAG